MPDGYRISAPSNNPFIQDDVLTFSEVIVQIRSDENLTVNQRRDWASAIRRVLELLDLDPERTPASIVAIKKKLQGVHHAQANISAKTLANLKSNTLAALRHVGASDSNLRHTGGLSESWQVLWDSIENEQVRWKLSRLFGYASAQKIDPKDVNDALIERLLEALIGESFVKDPEETVRSTIYAWNRAGTETANWPSVRLKRRPTRQENWTLQLHEFPQSFQQDLDDWISRLRGDDPFAEDAVPRPLRPATLKHRTFQVRMFASALVRRNMPPERIINLGVLIEPVNFKESLRFMLERNDNHPTEAIYGCAMAIKAIAEHYNFKAPPDQLKQLQQMCSRIKVKTRGLTAKNRKRLSQFDDPANVAALLQLPDKLEALASRTQGRKAAVLMQMAIAIELLTMCPLRISNLASLKLGGTIQWTRPGRKGRLIISIPPETVKNNQPITFEVHKEIVPRIVRYLDNYRSLLFDDPGDWLFPGRNGNSKQPGNLGKQIKETIFKQSGLIVNVHSIRHIMSKIYLNTNPGSLSIVQRVLGHSSIDTTTRNYTGFENQAAVQHFDATILQQREASSPARTRNRRRSSK